MELEHQELLKQLLEFMNGVILRVSELKASNDMF